MAVRSKARILYMEGAAGRKRSVRKHLKGKGFAVDVAAEGRRGLASLGNGTYDVVIVSSNLADMDGLEVIRKLARRREMPATIMVCPPDDPKLGLKALRLGASDCVVSSGDGELPVLLEASVGRILEKRKLKKQKQTAETELIEKTALFGDIMANLDEGLCVFDKDLRLTMWNDRYVELYGFPKKLLKIGTPLEAFFRYNAERGEYGDSPSTDVIAERLKRVRRRRPHDYEHIRPGGPAIEVRGKPMPDGGFVSTHTDITERKRAEEAARLAMTVFDTATEGVIVMDADKKFVSVNPAFTEISGYRPKAAIGKSLEFLNAGQQEAAFYEAIYDSLAKAGKWQGEIWNRHKEGDASPQWWSISAIPDADGRAVKYTAIFQDITQRKKHEETIVRQATFDALTNLPNRLLFMDRLAVALKVSARNGQRLALMFIDLDHFKKINDTMGHKAGDQVLQETARRLNACLRKSDTAARLSGDEFTVILPAVREARYAERVARKILNQLAKPYTIQGSENFISGSIGITLFPDDGEDAETLLRNADTAMYEAKKKGRNGYCFFTAEMNAAMREVVKLERDLRRAIEGEEFVLQYQPIIDSKAGTVTGTEALLRWDSPSRGYTSPQDFVPVAEDTGLIVPIGEWVLRSAIEQVRAWRDAGLPSVCVAVNLSLRQCRDPAIAKTLEGILKETGVDPKLIILEITEGLLMDSREADVGKVLKRFRAMGVHLSLDDFGTGYSSLSTLKRFPVNSLKIDRLFINDMTTDPENKALVEAIITMAHGTGIIVIAEGVETREQAELLQALQCDRMQGYYFSKPLSPEKFAEFMRHQDGE